MAARLAIGAVSSRNLTDCRRDARAAARVATYRADPVVRTPRRCPYRWSSCHSWIEFAPEVLMRYRLRTLLIVLALGPGVLAGLWFAPAFIQVDELRWGIFAIGHGLVAYIACVALAAWLTRRASNTPIG